MTIIDPAAMFAGSPDGLQRLWTPHRMAYIDGEARPADTSPDACPFCAAPEVDDAQGLIVHRGETCFVVMNLFPYNSGHLLVCPYRHVADFTELTDKEREELGQLTSRAMTVLRASLRAQGINLGMNQGEAAGAGIAAHLHQHIIPRWIGDANFFPLVARTKALPQLLEDTRRQLSDVWDEGKE